MYVRRAHEESDWGRFICRFALGVDRDEAYEIARRELPPLLEL
ncbi:MULTISPECIES: hypothetical protein [Acinetobacter]|nr:MULTISPECIES: hypothetical protein [Acinetobacter]